MSEISCLAIATVYAIDSVTGCSSYRIAGGIIGRESVILRSSVIRIGIGIWLVAGYVYSVCNDEQPHSDYIHASGC